MFVLSDTKTRRRNYLPNPTAMKPVYFSFVSFFINDKIGDVAVDVISKNVG